METIFDKERTFGLELEFVGDPYDVRDVLRQFDIDCQYENYNHVTRDYWKIVSDSSCGYELVSPPLKGEKGIEEVKKVCEALKNANASVNKNTGFHVHHDASDFTVDVFKRLYCIYVRYENVIDSMMPNSRRGSNNWYCKSVCGICDDIYDAFDRKQVTLQKIKSCKSIVDIERLFNTRYLKLNVQSYVKHGTIEFRQHSGTLDFQKILNWVILTQLMITKAKNSNVKMSYFMGQDNFDSFVRMMNMVKSKGADKQVESVVKFYKKRIKDLEAA